MVFISHQHFVLFLTSCLHSIIHSTSQLTYTGNIAINKPASESKQYRDRQASYAVDGNNVTTNIDVCATTDPLPVPVDDYAWWQVDLGDTYLVTSVTLFPADMAAYGFYDGSYLKNCNVYISSDPAIFSNQQICVHFGDPFPIPVGQSYNTFNCTRLLAGRYIRIMKYFAYQPITLCEFMATGSVLQSTLQGEFAKNDETRSLKPFTSTTIGQIPDRQLLVLITNTGNVALSRPASLKKTWGGDVNGRFARYAVDGDTSTSDLNRCAMGDDLTSNNWLQVDLGDEYVVVSITMYVPDSNSVSNSNIYVGDTLTDVTSQPSCALLPTNLAIPSGSSGLTINCTSWIVGRYITIWKNVPGELLAVCELFVSATTSTPATTTTTTTTTRASTSTSSTSPTPSSTTTSTTSRSTNAASSSMPIGTTTTSTSPTTSLTTSTSTLSTTSTAVPSVTLSLRVPVVTSVSPLFGPVAGGTLVTLTGQWLNLSNSQITLEPFDRALYGVYNLLNAGDKSQPTYNTLIVVTPEISSNLLPEAITKLRVNVVFSGGQILYTNSLFDFRQNPSVTGVSPAMHLISGGTLVTLSGVNIDSAAVPQINVVTVVQRFSDSTDPGKSTIQKISNYERCISTTSTTVTCLMPRVPLPQDFESYLNDTITQGSAPIVVSGNGAMSIRGPNGRDQATVYIGAIFDGYRYYDNFTSALPSVQMKLYSPPIINSFNGTIDFNPRKQSYLEVFGKNMALGAQLIDYVVLIGSGRCVGKELTDNVLRCQPPVDEPLVDVSFNNKCAELKLNSVLVRVAATNPVVYSCIRYVSDPVNIALIIGLSVGLGGSLFIGVVIVCLVHRKRNTVKKTKSTSSPHPYDDVQIPASNQYNSIYDSVRSEHPYVNSRVFSTTRT